MKGLKYLVASGALHHAIAHYKVANNRWDIIAFSRRFPVICAGTVRELDFAIFYTANITEPGKLPRYPRVLAEIVLERRSLSAAHQYCIEHFGLIPNLQAAMLFKFFSRHPTTCRFAAVAVLYRRAATGPFVADAVSFGTCPLRPSSADPAPIFRALRYLPDAPYPAPQQDSSPWPPALRPTLSVPAEDILGPRSAAGSPGPGLKGTEDQDEPLAVDLWRMLHAVCILNDGSECVLNE